MSTSSGAVGVGSNPPPRSAATSEGWTLRPQAVAFFLVDVSFLSDSKFRALARRLPDPDELNSAIGAYFVALAAARRRGRPNLDAGRETFSRFVPDLIEVELLTETGLPPEAFASWGAMSPQQAAAGKARASAALRDDAGRYLPAESSEPSALGIPSSAVQPSPPLPSGSSSSFDVGGGAGGNDDPAVAFQERTGEFPGTKMLGWLDDLAEAHGEGRLAATIRSTPMIGKSSSDYLKVVRDKLRAEDHTADLAERAAEKRRVTERRSESTPTRISDTPEYYRILAEISKPSEVTS